MSATVSKVLYWQTFTDGLQTGEAPAELARRYDFVVVGGGVTGLWAAWHIRGREPSASIAVLEADRIGHRASGRNAGMLTSHLGWTYSDVLRRYGEEKAGPLARVGHDNALKVIERIKELGIDCDLHECDLLVVSTHPSFDGRIARDIAAAERLGVRLESLDREAIRERIASPVLTRGYAQRGGLVNPAKLTVGLAAWLMDHGVEIHERTPATGVRALAEGCEVVTPRRRLEAGRVILARNAWSVHERPRAPQVQPVTTYGAVTAPLSARQWSDLGWRGGEGIWDKRAMIYSFRPTPDGRILFAGASTRFPLGTRLTARRLESKTGDVRALRQGFDLIFPQLADLPFEMTWGGLVSTTPDHIPKVGARSGGLIAYAHGDGGHGLAQSHLISATAVDLSLGQQTERTNLLLTENLDLAYPPEPFRWLGGTAAAGSMCRHDTAMQAGRRLDREYWLLELSNRLLEWLRPGRAG